MIQEKKFKIDFQDGSHPVFAIGPILAIFDIQVTSMILIKFQVSWPFNSGEEAKNRFSRRHHGGHLGFPIRKILAIFDLPVPPMLPTKFRVNWPFGSREEAINMVAILDF